MPHSVKLSLRLMDLVSCLTRGSTWRNLEIGNTWRLLDSIPERDKNI